jgi:hypothetical protein
MVDSQVGRGLARVGSSQCDVASHAIAGNGITTTPQRETTMPRTCKFEAPILVDEPIIEGRYVEMDGYDRCQCPHWGVVRSGRVVMRYADHDETYTEGDAYYARPPTVDVRWHPGCRVQPGRGSCSRRWRSSPATCSRRCQPHDDGRRIYSATSQCHGGGYRRPASMTSWRCVATGIRRRAGCSGPATPNGFVLEVEETWEAMVTSGNTIRGWEGRARTLLSCCVVPRSLEPRTMPRPPRLTMMRGIRAMSR